MATGELGEDNLRRAVQGFADLLAYDVADLPEIVRDGIENGRIQKFEVSAELFWKYLRSVLLAEGRMVANSPRQTLKDALARGFLLNAEYDAAFQIYEDRNRCSHIYKQEMIPGILARLPDHLAVMQAVFARLPPASEYE